MSLTKGGFLSGLKSKINKTAPPSNPEKKKEPEIKKELTPYEQWFKRNCDNNNLPDLAEINSHDYESWFLRHSTKRAPDPKYSSPYEAWFFRNCDNRNIPDLSKVDQHDYTTWFKKHSVKSAPYTCDKSYEAWFERNRDSKNPGVNPEPVLTYEQWFCKHCTPSLPVKYECVKHEPYEGWFKRHSIK